MNHKAIWERALRQYPDKARIFGPPAQMVLEVRKGKEEIRITRERMRQEYGLGPAGVEGK